VAKIIGYGCIWSKNGKKTVESSDFRAVKINFGTLTESRWEEELSTAAMKEF